MLNLLFFCLLFLLLWTLLHWLFLLLQSLPLWLCIHLFSELLLLSTYMEQLSLKNTSVVNRCTPKKPNCMITITSCIHICIHIFVPHLNNIHTSNWQQIRTPKQLQKSFFAEKNPSILTSINTVKHTIA